MNVGFRAELDREVEDISEDKKPTLEAEDSETERF